MHKAPGPGGLDGRVLKECIPHILALIYNESLAMDNVPDDWRQERRKIRCCELQTGVANLHLLQNPRAYIGR